SSCMEGRPTLSVTSIHIGTTRYEQGHNLHIVINGTLMEWSESIFIVRIWIRPEIEKTTNFIDIISASCIEYFNLCTKSKSRSLLWRRGRISLIFRIRSQLIRTSSSRQLNSLLRVHPLDIWQFGRQLSMVDHDYRLISIQ
ncbi:hypothetical protein PFISCL1PPCAC_19618, partial [Pristionchus fissidentatus]